MSNTKRVSSFQVYWRLLGHVKPYWRAFFISIIGFIIFALSQPAIAKLLEYFVALLDGTKTFAIMWMPISILVLAVVRGLGSFLGNFYLNRVSLFIIRDLRLLMFNKMIMLPFSYYDHNNSGHLITRIIYNVSLVSEAATIAIRTMIREGMTVFFTLAYLFWTNWKLALIFLGVTPIIALVVRGASKTFRSLSQSIQASMGDVTHVTAEMINGYRIVRGFSGETYEKQRFKDCVNRNTRDNMRLNRASSIHSPILQLLISCALAALLYIILWFRGDTTTASLVGFITAAFLLPKPVRMLSEVNSIIQKGIAAAMNVFEMIDETPEVNTGQVSKSEVLGRLCFKNVWFRYAKSENFALKGINFTIEPNQTIALVGSSGSGKSTLVNLILRFYECAEGDITLDGISLKEYQLENLRSHIAQVNQNITLFNATVAENIAYGALNNRNEDDIRLAVQAAHATDFVNSLPDGLNTLIGENGTLLSGGQRQRLAIARAILKDAPVLILDEATSALDTESERHIQAALHELVENRTTLIIAHRLSTIENADSIIVMDAGRIVEMGTHTTLLEKKGVYARLYNIQFKKNKI